MIFFSLTRDPDALTGEFFPSTTAEAGSPVSGRLVVRNNQQLPIRLVGSVSSKCNGSLIVDAPISVASYELVEIEAIRMFAKQEGKFISGVVSFAVESNNLSRIDQINWIGVNPTKVAK